MKKHDASFHFQKCLLDHLCAKVKSVALQQSMLRKQAVTAHSEPAGTPLLASATPACGSNRAMNMRRSRVWL